MGRLEITNIYSCSGCDKTYASLHSLKRHIKTSCPNPTPIDMEKIEAIRKEHGLLKLALKNEKFPCPKCGKEYTQKGSLDKHIETCDYYEKEKEKEKKKK